jgi:hypothetical protein
LQTGIGYLIKKGTTYIPLQRLWNLGASRVAKIREHPPSNLQTISKNVREVVIASLVFLVVE